MSSGRTVPVFFPSGVAGPDLTTGYVANSTGGIEALDLGTGELLWHSEIVGRPVLARDRRVAVVRRAPQCPNALQIVLLDAKERGRVILESDPLHFPDWVAPETVPDAAFHYDVTAEGNELRLRWTAHARYRGGAAPPRGMHAAPPKTAFGIVHVDFSSGAARMSHAETQPHPELPAALRDVTLFSYRMGAGDVWLTEPWLAGDKIAAITGEISGGAQALTLQRVERASGRIEPPVPLVTGEALVSYVTPDGCYIFVHSEASAASVPRGPRPWWVFSAASGKQVALLEYEPTTKEACVLSARVYYIVDVPSPAADGGAPSLLSILEAREMSGAALWRRELSARRMAPRGALRQ